MLEKLVILANQLDKLGLFKEADLLDELLKQASMSPEEYAKYYGKPMDMEKLKEWMALKHKSRPTTTKTCPKCNKQLVFMYPGNDPENGRADFRCKEGHQEAEPCELCNHFFHDEECKKDGCNCYSSWGTKEDLDKRIEYYDNLEKQDEGNERLLNLVEKEEAEKNNDIR
jgi:hypothetical protein